MTRQRYQPDMAAGNTSAGRTAAARVCASRGDQAFANRANVFLNLATLGAATIMQ